MNGRTFLLLLALLASRGTAAAAAAEEVILQVRGPAATLRFTAAEFAALPHEELTATEPHEKKIRRYAGVPMREILLLAGAPLGEKMRGPALALGVLVRSKDGYAVLYALAEFDENFSSRTLLLADREDGAAPPATAALLRLIAPGDKRGARWARPVSSIEIVSLPNPP